MLAPFGMSSVDGSLQVDQMDRAGDVLVGRRVDGHDYDAAMLRESVSATRESAKLIAEDMANSRLLPGQNFGTKPVYIGSQRDKTFESRHNRQTCPHGTRGTQNRAMNVRGKPLTYLDSDGSARLKL